jgi:lipopolysaccharide transport system permease protein
MLANIWQYRQFIYSCVKREFQVKYTGSVLGMLWAVFQPLAMIFVYTFIFSEIMRSKLSGMETIPYAYSIYLCAGVLTWGLFSETLMNCVNVFLVNANLMKKVFFPRICLPIITMSSAFLNFIIGFILFLIFMVLIGRFPINGFVFFLIVLIAQMMFSVTLGIGLGVLNVFFRDIGQMLSVVLQFWFWFTPVVYPVTVIPEQFRWLVNLNPMYHIIRGYQNIFVYNQSPDIISIVGVFLLSLVLGFWSLNIYRKHVGEMVDEL